MKPAMQSGRVWYKKITFIFYQNYRRKLVLQYFHMRVPQVFSDYKHAKELLSCFVLKLIFMFTPAFLLLQTPPVNLSKRSEHPRYCKLLTAFRLSFLVLRFACCQLHADTNTRNAYGHKQRQYKKSGGPPRNIWLRSPCRWALRLSARRRW